MDAHHVEDDLVDVDRFGEALGDAELAAQLAAGRLARLEEGDDREAVPLARGGGEVAEPLIARGAGEDEEDRLPSHVGERLAGGEQLDVEAGFLEGAAEADRGLEVVGGDDDGLAQGNLTCARTPRCRTAAGPPRRGPARRG